MGIRKQIIIQNFNCKSIIMQSWIPSRSTLISSALALTKCLELMLNLNYDNEIRLQLALETVADNFF